MDRTKLALVAVAIATLSTATTRAQNTSAVNIDEVPRADVSLGYNYIKANAPPGGCECFGLNGGYASGSYRLLPWLSVAGEFTGSHAKDISLLGQDLTLLTFAAGPRVAFPRKHIVPYVQALFGVAHGSDSYFPTSTGYTTSSSVFDVTAGGGVDINLDRRFAVRIIEAQYMHTSFANGSNNEQNNLMLGAGIVFKFGERHLKPAYVPPPPPVPVVVPQPHREIAFSCSTSMMSIEPGQKIDVLVSSMTEPDGLDVAYTWTASGGTIEGTGRDISLDTTGLAPGRYHITGHAVAASDPAVSSSCEVSFRVHPHVEADIKAEIRKQDDAFHANVKDAYFDYDKSDIRPDALAAIQQAAAYLNLHPDINVLIGGYSDERGSSEYNLSLGLKRSEATRKALIDAGIDGDRLQVISYGKGTQVCTTRDEACFQQNRRAAFEMHQ